MNKRLVLIFKTAVISIMLIASCAFAIGNDTHRNNKYSGNHWALLDVKQVMTAAGQISSATFPDCDEAIVDAKSVRIYHEDGTAESQDEFFTKILTNKGKTENDVLDCYFMLPYETVEITGLEILKANGAAIPVDVSANSKESIDSSQMESNIYDPNHRVLEVNIPGLEVGDTVHSVVRYTTLRPFIPGEYSESFLMEQPAYIHHLSLEIRAPKKNPLKHIMIKNQIDNTVTYSKLPDQNGFTVHHWEMAHVPRMNDEPGMPSYRTVLQRLLVSTIPDWQTVSNWYWKLSKPHLEATVPEMQTTVNQLIGTAVTEQDKIKALFYYVSKQIRYMGITPEQDHPGFEPHDVKLTFLKKYGVCRDKAALLVSMLRMAGLNAYPVLTNVGAKLDPEVPQVAFNHAIAAVELDDGSEVLMDPTNENTLDLLPSLEDDQSYLVCRPDAAQLKTTPITPADKNMLQIKTTGSLSDSGHLEAHSILMFNGVNDNIFRDLFATMKPDKQRIFFERALRAAVPGAHLIMLQLDPRDMLDTSSPLHAEINFTVDQIAAFGSNKAILTVPWISNSLSIVNSILRNASLAQRKYPLETYVTCGLSEEISIKIPDNFHKSLSLPASTSIDDPGLNYTRQFSFKDATLSCSKVFKLKAVEFSPQEYLKLKQILQEQDEDERKMPVYAVNGHQAHPAADGVDADTLVSSDVQIIMDQHQLLVKDAHTATLKVHYIKEILSYNGKKNESEVKIAYNPSCQDVKLISASVVQKSGGRQTVNATEIHTMDAEWNASAKRYPGGGIFVANLPGVDIGSTIDVEYEVISKDRPYLCGFNSFQLTDELEQKSFQIIAPSEIPVKHLMTGPSGIISEQSKTGANQQFIWLAQHVKALPGDTQLPPGWTFTAGVGYFIGEPAAYLKELNQELTARAGHCENSRKIALELTGHTSTPLAALTAIRDYIAKSIRLAGPSFTELPLDELSDADTTLADGYGHRADRAILFYAMLKAAGFKPQFILASNLPQLNQISKVARSFPMLNYFQIPLVKVKVDNVTLYFNDTDQYAKLGATPYDGKLAIALPNLTYETIHSIKDCLDQATTTYSLALSDDGKARIHILRKYYGRTFGEKNQFFTEATPEQRKQYYEEAVSSIAQGSRQVGALKTDFSAYPGIEEFSVEVDHYAVSDGKYFYFSVPFIPKLLSTGTGHRNLPLYISEGFNQIIRVKIELPGNFRKVAIAPNALNFNVSGGGGTAQILSEKTNNKLILTYQLSSHPAIIDPQDYSGLQAFESSLESQSSTMILLESEKAGYLN